MDKKTDIGLRIKSIRLAKGLNLREFGEEISKLTKEKKYISDSIVSRWEKGVSIPNAKRLKAIAEYGNVSINFLLYGNEISYEDIYQNIKSVNMKNNIQDKLIDFIVNYMPSSEQNTY
ncbi:TPA: helix-turn-helix transcriptional regulator, partial [Staphylococcus aureus]|nr:helix-turn-helix transcriptional regulator [Staphylococcus aureus]